MSAAIARLMSPVGATGSATVTRVARPAFAQVHACEPQAPTVGHRAPPPPRRNAPPSDVGLEEHADLGALRLSRILPTRSEMAKSTRRLSPNSPERAGAWLATASALFWCSWLLSPNTGMAHLVSWSGWSFSDVVRVGAAVAYALGLGSLVRLDREVRLPAARFGAVLLLIGVVGLSAEPLFHFGRAQIFLVVFFVGHLGVVLGMSNRTRPSQLAVAALLLTPLISIVGWLASGFYWVPRPIIGLMTLGALTGSLGLAALGYLVSAPVHRSETFHQREP